MDEMKDEKELLEKALLLGFANAALTGTDRITFIPNFRALCAENTCGKYGANHACPPDCGTVEEMREKLLAWPRALVLQTMWDIEDPLDNAQIKPAKARHNQMTRRLMAEMGVPCLMVGASGCDLCDPCTAATGQPCRFPDKQASCMSAYCIFVEELARNCGMEYDCGPGVTAFFTMICFGAQSVRKRRFS